MYMLRRDEGRAAWNTVRHTGSKRLSACYTYGPAAVWENSRGGNGQDMIGHRVLAYNRM